MVGLKPGWPCGDWTNGLPLDFSAYKNKLAKSIFSTKGNQNRYNNNAYILKTLQGNKNTNSQKTIQCK